MPETIRIGGLELQFFQSREDGEGSLDLFEMTVQPNARMPVAHHHESWDETIYGLAGVTVWRLAGNDITLRLGSTVFIRRGVAHGFRNDTQESARCLCILNPGVLGPEYFREMATLVGGGILDPMRMKQTMLRYGLIPAPGS